MLSECLRFKGLTIPSVGKGVEKLELSYNIAGKNPAVQLLGIHAA